MMGSNVTYSFSADGNICYGRLANGKQFIIDSDMYPLIENIKFYLVYGDRVDRVPYISDAKGNLLHTYIMPKIKGMEIDHVNMDTMDNRKSNLRICTHQQNQMNQDLQKNNTSGVTGVSYYKPRGKYRDRIKIGQHDIHLGYYKTFQEAVQARNVGMECMFGEYGRYNAVPKAPNWIKDQVKKKCLRFAELSVCRAFLLSESSIWTGDEAKHEIRKPV